MLLHLYTINFTKMNERLKQFLTMEGISPARFAEIVGINRSGISHLLAGRNKPSFEFIQKMLVSFPTLNPEWLILGKGKPYKDGTATVEESLFQMEPSEPEIFEEPQQPSEPLQNQINNPAIEYDREISAGKIARITVFYTDGTFEDR